MEPDPRKSPRNTLVLDAQQRAQLALEPNESVRVVSSGVRTILLERTGAPSQAALPWDRDLVLSADVRAFPLADTLNLLHSSAKSGFLFFTHQDHAKSVYLHRGEVVFGTSNQNVDRLGECLLRAGVISLEQLREAERCHVPSVRFGRVLVERGFVTPRQLWDAVKAQVEEVVRSLFSYTAGTVYFWEGEVEPDNVVRLSLPTQRLVAEGLERRHELLKFLALLEDPRVRLVPVDGAGDNLEGNERDLFEALRADGSFPTLCRRAGLDPLSAARTVQLLQLSGKLKLGRTRGDDLDLGDPDGSNQDADGVRQCALTYVKLIAELAAPIVAVEGADGLRERLSEVVKEAGKSCPGLLSGFEIGPGISIDPKEIVNRALRLPGDRARQVASALGELVAYLEFELKNHPRIEDPDQFFEGLEGLRSAIEV